ncbi:MAG: AmmeMemoRadiSam system radical SAM enzyme [Chitinivibrionales bacterium]|nr:AmmeMemoRadiSam system radical SAM enzyme [Chitinivibrionales bacterium]
MKKASYSTPLDDKKVRCELCPHHCLLTDGKRGVCLTRQNRDGILYSLNYCRPVSLAVDPVEKKPLYHFYPGSSIFSTGPNGCTLKCSFCQNFEISQDTLPVRKFPEDAIIEKVCSSSSMGIAYTYSEPFIWFETIMNIGAEIKARGLKNVMVTNGFMEQKPLDELLNVVDAMNIDIKSMRPEFYTHLCKGKLEPVLASCEKVKKHAHLEITNLVVTGENDTEKDFSALARYIAQNLGKDTPLHLSRYFPRYKSNNPATPEETVKTAWEIAKEYLNYVFIGNMESGDCSNTRCPSCNTLLIDRNGYFTKIHEKLGAATGNKRACCPKCGVDTGIIL